MSYTLWSGEFIQTGGATIAQVLYMLGVEPVRDRYGRVSDIRLIPSAQLGRPRIDVVVQTSGQLRDLAVSRLFLISRAVRMAAEAGDEQYDNGVKAGVEESERYLIDKGIAPKQAREMAAYRVFGGAGGDYGTGIQSMVEQGNAWDDEQQIADIYMNNMGAFYGDQEHWMSDVHEAFTAALTRTDVVVQPRQNNTWGALTLDHVYEFMKAYQQRISQSQNRADAKGMVMEKQTSQLTDAQEQQQSPVSSLLVVAVVVVLFIVLVVALRRRRKQ